MGCIHWTGLPGQEHGDLTQGCRGAAEPRHQGQALGTAHAGNTGQQRIMAIYVVLPVSEWTLLFRSCEAWSGVG